MQEIHNAGSEISHSLCISAKGNQGSTVVIFTAVMLFYL
jgi:hypothetical protein